MTHLSHNHILILGWTSILASLSPSARSAVTIEPVVAIGMQHRCVINESAKIECCLYKYDYDQQVERLNCEQGFSSPDLFKSILQVNDSTDTMCALKLDTLGSIPIVCWTPQGLRDSDFPKVREPIESIAVLNGEGCVLTQSGKLICRNGERSRDDAIVKQVTFGYEHLCMRHDTGKVTCVGNNRAGQLDVPPDLKKSVQISAGIGHTCSLSEDGSITCWGAQGSGRSNASRIQNAVQIAVGYAHGCAVVQNGKVECWGSRDKNRTPAPKALNHHVIKKLFIIASRSCALTNLGEALCWTPENKNPSSIFGPDRAGMRLYQGFLDFRDLKTSLLRVRVRLVPRQDIFFNEVSKILDSVSQIPSPTIHPGIDLRSAFIFYAMEHPIRQIQTQHARTILLPNYGKDLSDLKEKLTFESLSDFPSSPLVDELTFQLLLAFSKSLESIVTTEREIFHLGSWKESLADLSISGQPFDIKIQRSYEIYQTSSLLDLALSHWATRGQAQMIEELMRRYKN